ncbi:hypothetical protein [uncultured Pelagimonas sp.]|uniref:hypothetical protein n=1 Tax=uncultured Pelagimonas sp. TaxID=1618102 RepID=UPI00260D6DA4|nr:hypothetical protein [uncultured Pelagimonas sp.]
MSANYAIYPQHRLIVLTFTGVFAPETAEKTTKAYLADPLFENGYEQIIDLSGVTEVDAKFKEMSGFVDNTANRVKTIKRSRCVLVATSEVVYGMARMYQQLGADKFPYDVLVVRSEKDALKTFGIAATHLSDL